MSGYRKKFQVICYSYTMVYPPVGGDNPQALASELSPIQADKQ